MIKRCKKCKGTYRHKSNFREYCSYQCAGDNSLDKEKVITLKKHNSKYSRYISCKRNEERDLWRFYWKWRFMNRRPVDERELEVWIHLDYRLKIRETYYSNKNYENFAPRSTEPNITT